MTNKTQTQVQHPTAKPSKMVDEAQKFHQYNIERPPKK